MTMIERVARAICERQLVDPDAVDPLDLSHKKLAMWRRYVPDAVAAIEAMRVPTQEVLWRVYREIGGEQDFPIALKGYQAMIDAALKEEAQA